MRFTACKHPVSTDNFLARRIPAAIALSFPRNLHKAM
jgi:hypothetical protein